MMAKTEHQYCLEYFKFCGLKFSNLDKETLLDDTKFAWIVPVNAQVIDIAMRDKFFCSTLSQAILTIDGQVPLWLAKIKHRKSRIQKISGSDLIFDVLKKAKTTSKNFLIIGGSEKSNASAVDRARKQYGVNAFGISPIVDDSGESSAGLMDQIEKAKPYYLFVCFGAPKQEFWVKNNIEKLKNNGVMLIVCAGGAVNFLSGSHKRAPRLIQSVGLEGVYRFAIEPTKARLNRLLKSFSIFKYAFWS